MRCSVCFAVALVIVLQPSSAHAASVTGVFVEKDGRTPLAAVQVAVRSVTDSAVVAHAETGADGRFRVAGLRFDRYRLRASLLGHETYVRADVVLSEGAPSLDLGTQVLAVSPIALKGVETSTARASAIIAPDRNIYLAKDMPMATTGTTTDLLRAVPELDVDIDGNVSLRGSSSVTIQINGRTSPLKGEALTTFLRQLPANRIERVEVAANPSARFDPEGMAGIVNIVTKDEIELGLSGSAYVMAGSRYNALGTHLAWQKGPVTLFGGVSSSLFDWKYESSLVRRSLLTSPPSGLVSEVSSDYDGSYNMLDASVDYAMTKRTTLYGSVNGYQGRNEPDMRTDYALWDSAQTVTSAYDEADDSRADSRTMSLTAGLQQVVQAGRDERSVEFMQSGSNYDSHTDGVRHTLVPADAGDLNLRQWYASGYRERSVQADDARPLGAHGKLELGYRGVERRTTLSSAFAYSADDSLVAVPAGDGSDYAHREVFHSGYVTLGGTLGRLSLQGGARAEGAHTTFDARSSGQHFGKDYRSLFPSLNVAWDFGKGCTVRATYSKRIERPPASYLNPDVPAADTLNRVVGNPDLGPRYTHSYSLDASWTGSRGSLRLSPYLRRTVDNWDRVMRVDADGAATTTMLNASSVSVFGATLTGSLRQTGRFGGTMSIGVSREHHDASNLSSQYRRDVTGGSANASLMFKATKKLDLQTYLRYAPATALAQGRSSAYVGSSLTARYQFGEKAWLSLSVNDPFNLSHYSSTTGDATYQQSSTSNNRMRSLSGSFTWSWGKPPEQKKRRQTAEQPQPAEEPGQGR